MRMDDDRQIILADLNDVKTALLIWADFYQTQSLKVSYKAIELLKKLPVDDGRWKDKKMTLTAPELARMYGMKQRTVEDYMKGLYEAGLIYREQRPEAGAPWGYWIDEKTRAIIDDADKAKSDFALKPATGARPRFMRMTSQDFFLRKYMAKFSSDSLTDSYNAFLISNNNIIEKCKGVEYKDGRAWSLGEARENIPSLLLGPKMSALIKNEPLDIEKLFCVNAALNVETSTDSENDSALSPNRFCVNTSPPSSLQRDLKEPMRFARKEPDIVFLALVSHDLSSHEWPDFIRAEEILLGHREEEREAMFNKKAEKLMEDADKSEEVTLD